jgi:hypothetical protein
MKKPMGGAAFGAVAKAIAISGLMALPHSTCHCMSTLAFDWRITTYGDSGSGLSSYRQAYNAGIVSLDVV